MTEVTPFVCTDQNFSQRFRLLCWCSYSSHTSLYKWLYLTHFHQLVGLHLWAMTVLHIVTPEWRPTGSSMPTQCTNQDAENFECMNGWAWPWRQYKNGKYVQYVLCWPRPFRVYFLCNTFFCICFPDPKNKLSIWILSKMFLRLTRARR